MTNQTILDLSRPLERLHGALDTRELGEACGELIEQLFGPVEWQIRESVRGPSGGRPYLAGAGRHVRTVSGENDAVGVSWKTIDLSFRKEVIGHLLVAPGSRVEEDEAGILSVHIGAAMTKLQLWKQEEIECAERRLGSEMLGDISAIAGSFDRDFVLARLLEQVLRVVGSDVGLVMLRDESDFTNPVILGLPREVADCIRLDGTPVCETVAEAGEPLILHDPDLGGLPDPWRDVELRSLLVLPLRNGDRVLGVVATANPKVTSYDSPYLEIAERLCHLAAISVDNAALHAEAVRKERQAVTGQVMAGLSHDIRNMLHAMQAGMYLLRSGVEKKDLGRVVESYPVLEQAMERVSTLVLDMLEFSMTRTPRREPVDVNSLIGEAVEANERLAKEKDVRFVLDLDDRIGTVPIDSAGIFRCVANLLTNAVEAMEGGGTVTISTGGTDARGAVTVSVRDDGPGIADNDMPHLFDALFTTKGSKGTGLGLAVTRKIVEEHGGEILVHRPAQGGTEFVIRLPGEIGPPIERAGDEPDRDGPLSNRSEK